MSFHGTGQWPNFLLLGPTFWGFHHLTTPWRAEDQIMNMWPLGTKQIQTQASFLQGRSRDRADVG